MSQSCGSSAKFSKCPAGTEQRRLPDWRDLDQGIAGQDMSQLNHDLVDLGYADRADIVALGWDYYSWETAYAAQRLEEHLGVPSPSGSLSVGQVVFEPGGAAGQPGDREPGRPGLRAGAGRDVGPARGHDPPEHLAGVAGGGGGRGQGHAAGRCQHARDDSSVGTVASGTASSATIPVTVTLTQPSAAGTLDQAPVTVNITTESSPGPVLAVPVTALLAQAPGGYVVQVAGRGNTPRYVPVTIGPIFDDANGLVQVTGALTPGQRVVVAAS